MTIFGTAQLAVVQILAEVPKIDPTPPPGSQGFLTVLNWMGWFVFFAALAGFLGCLIAMAFSAITGREMQHVKGLFVTIIVCILASAAGAIIGIFVK